LSHSRAATFYAELEPFSNFAEVADPRHYAPAPDDWLLVIADIKGSTGAARAGRYKDVNLVGAACITATLNATRGLDLPYVFGGDGATILIPPTARAAVASALTRTRRLAADGFGLTLRVGIVPLARLAAEGGRVLVARYELSPGNHLAMLAGGGAALADRLVKDQQGFALPDDDQGGPPDLEGLSCRWQPYPSLRGRMLTLLVRTRDNDSLTLQQEIIARLGAILADGRGATPIQRANMRFTWPPAGLRAEAILTHGDRPRWQRRLYLLLETLLQLFADRLGLKIGTYDAPAYREELRRNSDHRKVADTLHMVLDCTAAEVAAIEAYLAGLHAGGRIVYGTHLADSAMMTCLVFSLAESRHVHFIDGADGGYALAALQLKSQLQALAPTPPRDGSLPLDSASRSEAIPAAG
jgi:hypothetical protein